MVAQVSLKSSREWLRYEKNNYTKQIKPQTTSYARLCKANKKELEEKTTAYQNILWLKY